MKIENLIFDLDGTLLSTDQTPLKQTVDYLNQLQQKGIKITFATGRSHILVRRTAQYIKPDYPIISSNGALLYDFKLEKPVNIIQLSVQSITKIVQLLIKQQESFFIYTDQKIFAFESPRARCERMYLMQKQVVEPDISKNNYVINPFAMANRFDFAAHKITKILLVTNNRQELAELKQKLTSFSDISFVSSFTFALDVMARDVSKVVGMEFLKTCGLDPNTTMMFGDGDNDVEIFNAVKYSVALKNASELAKQNANFICDYDHNNDGIYYFLKTFLEA